IEDALTNPVPEAVSPTAIRKVRGQWVWQAIAAVLVIALVIFVWAPWRIAPPALPAAPLRLSSELGADVSLAANTTGNSALALSPDGSILAFVGTKNGAQQIYIRRLG